MSCYTRYPLGTDPVQPGEIAPDSRDLMTVPAAVFFGNGAPKVLPPWIGETRRFVGHPRLVSGLLPRVSSNSV
jgi:hypothetical protein